MASTEPAMGASCVVASSAVVETWAASLLGCPSSVASSAGGQAGTVRLQDAVVASSAVEKAETSLADEFDPYQAYWASYQAVAASSSAAHLDPFHHLGQGRLAAHRTGCWETAPYAAKELHTGAVEAQL